MRMWYSLWRTIQFRLKSFEISLSNLRFKLEIQRAYAEKGTGLRLPRISPAAFGQILRIGAVVLAVCILVPACALAYRSAAPAVSRLYEKIAEIRMPELPHFELKAPQQPKAPLQRPIAEKTVPHKNRAPAFPEGIDVPDASILSTMPSAEILRENGIPDAAMTRMILANKATHHFYLLEKQQKKWVILRDWFVGTGEIDGPKRSAGDKRTPIGLYFIAGRKNDHELEPKYGPLAFVLNYPNEYDVRMGYSGEGIWIHGTKPDTIPYKTLGCLELDNTHIADLGTILGNGIGTPVYIVDDPEMGDPERYSDYAKIERKRVRIIQDELDGHSSLASVVEAWRSAWSSRDIEAYADCYDENFNSQGMTKKTWCDRKSRIFSTQPSIRVKVERLHLGEIGESTAVVKFVQDYDAGAMQTRGGKKLSFVKRNGIWRIKTEATIPEEEIAL